jgi:glyoxylase-like metal-dependent hydrolase (beta-lactamase superfamily II)
VIEVGDLRLEVMATPGHAPGHVCFYERKHDILFGGDLIIGGTIGAPVAPASLGYRQQTSSATLASNSVGLQVKSRTQHVPIK